MTQQVRYPGSRRRTFSPRATPAPSKAMIPAAPHQVPATAAPIPPGPLFTFSGGDAPTRAFLGEVEVILRGAPQVLIGSGKAALGAFALTTEAVTGLTQAALMVGMQRGAAHAREQADANAPSKATLDADVVASTVSATVAALLTSGVLPRDGIQRIELVNRPPTEITIERDRQGRTVRMVAEDVG